MNIGKIVTCLTSLVAVMAMAKAEEVDGRRRIKEDFLDYYMALQFVDPVDLYPDGEADYRKGRLMWFFPNRCQNRAPAHVDEMNDGLPALHLEVSDYGQLEEALKSNNADSASEISISGPIDGADFEAIWECALNRRLQILDLSKAKIKDNTVPDYALYHPVQFKDLGWLGLRKIVLPEEVERIGVAAFAFMFLEEINIPKSLKVIGSTAFGYNYDLNCAIELPEGLEEIPYQTFAFCGVSNHSAKLPSTLRRVGDFAFACTSFNPVELNQGLEHIGEGAFMGSELSEFEIPNTVVELGELCFYHSRKLESLELPGSLKAVPERFCDSCRRLRHVRLLDGIESVASEAFTGCNSLMVVDIPQSLRSIEQKAFKESAMQILHLPANIDRLGDKCLDMETLNTVYCEATNPPVCEMQTTGPFHANVSKATLYVPLGSKASYQTATGWNQFNEIIETDRFPASGLSVNPDATTTIATIYDLSGRIVNRPQSREVYIRNGKKIVF